MFCPQCGVEYRESFTRCTDRDIELAPIIDNTPQPPVARPAPPANHQNAQIRIPFLLFSGLILGVLVTLAAQQGGRYWRRHHPKTSDVLFIWAYYHVPETVANPSPKAARTLDVEWQYAGSEAKGEVRLVYENNGVVRAVKTQYKVEDGHVVLPTDEELRSLNAASPSIPRQ